MGNTSLEPISKKTKAENEDEDDVEQGSSSYSSSSSYSLSNPPEEDKCPIVPLRRFAPLISAGFHICL